MRKAIPYGRQNITEEDIQQVVETLKADFLTQGPKIKEFEENFANYVGAKYAVAVSNGTAALHLSVLALDLKEGDKVITTPITFAASANCIRYIGAEVVFVDIDPETYLIDVEKLEGLLESHPIGTFKGVIPVAFTGLAVDLERIKLLAEKFGLWIVEDACHAPGANFTDSNGVVQKCGNGNFANTSVFSFHPVKHIAAGEGGMITTNDEMLYNKLMTLRTHGITKDNLELCISNPEEQGGWYYEQQELGYNYRITDIQASLANSQLARAEGGLRKRNEIAENYRKAFQKFKIKYQHIPKNVYHAYHLFIIEVKNRKELYDHLRATGIYAQIHYIPVHLMPYYQQLGWKEGDLPCAEQYYRECISLPMYPTLTEEEQEYVIEQVIGCIQ